MDACAWLWKETRDQNMKEVAEQAEKTPIKKRPAANVAYDWQREEP